MRLREALIVTPALLRRFQLEGKYEGADGRHYGLIPRDDGSWFSHHPYSPALPPEQMIWATDALRLLNAELDHGGAWVAVFTHVLPLRFDANHSEYGRYNLIWIDQDGDPQFSVEWLKGEGELRTFADVIAAGIGSTAQKCAAAWETWFHHMRRVPEIKPEQTFKRARGQRAPSARH